MGEVATQPPDDRYARRSVTIEPDAERVLDEVREATGKSYSEIVCLALLSLAGDRRLLRHALAQPLHALRLTSNLLAAKHPDDVELHNNIRDQFERIESILAPPKVKPKR